MTKSLSDSITASRQLLQDPYAYLSGNGEFDALPTASHSQAPIEHGLSQDLIHKYSAQAANTQIKSRYSVIEIEYRARSLQASLWQDRNRIWPNATPTNPINVLDPIIALRLLGYDCELDETLGQFHSDGKLVEIAGTLNKSTRQARISRQLPNAARSFTTAHELGHALLHDTGTALHRDRPLDGTTPSRPGIEFEADKFASFFLMPAKQVQAAFERFFLTDQFILNEATAFALGQGDYETLNNKCKTLRQLSRLLAGAEQYNGLHFISLADQFLVSPEAMAIRLEELGLVVL
jgi:IrrE N-terminal-like domain